MIKINHIFWYNTKPSLDLKRDSCAPPPRRGQRIQLWGKGACENTQPYGRCFKYLDVHRDWIIQQPSSWIQTESYSNHPPGFKWVCFAARPVSVASTTLLTSPGWGKVFLIRGVWVVKPCAKLPQKQVTKQRLQCIFIQAQSDPRSLLRYWCRWTFSWLSCTMTLGPVQ